MYAIRRILVLIDPNQPESLALKRAKLIGAVAGAHLHLLVCDKKSDHTLYLNELQHGLEAEDYSVTHQQHWTGSLHETLVAVVQAEGCDLLIKQHVPDNPLMKALLTPDDWKILRYTPCPVLMVKSAQSWLGGVVLAAIDAGNSDIEHRTLNAGIIANAAALAQAAKASLHLMSAHPSPMLSAADPTFQLSDTIEARYLKQVKGYGDEYNLPDAQLHIAEGPADVLIPYTCEKLSAAVTVMGTVARTGLAGALIGNTAEVVLDKLESDVLVLKPQDLLAPLETLVEQH